MDKIAVAMAGRITSAPTSNKPKLLDQHVKAVLTCQEVIPFRDPLRLPAPFCDRRRSLAAKERLLQFKECQADEDRRAHADQVDE